MDRHKSVELVNSLFEYEYDKIQYNVSDYWRILDVTKKTDLGDCEDYSLTIAWLLAKQNTFRFLWMLITKKIRICYISLSLGGHAVLEYDGLMVDNWKRKWTCRSDYEKDYSRYKWTFKFYYSWYQVCNKLIKGKFWKK